MVLSPVLRGYLFTYADIISSCRNYRALPSPEETDAAIFLFVVAVGSGTINLIRYVDLLEHADDVNWTGSLDE